VAKTCLADSKKTIIFFLLSLIIFTQVVYAIDEKTEISTDSNEVYIGQIIRVVGMSNLVNTVITIEVTKPDGKKESLTALTDYLGRFELNVKAEIEGVYEFKSKSNSYVSVVSRYPSYAEVPSTFWDRLAKGFWTSLSVFWEVITKVFSGMMNTFHFIINALGNINSIIVFVSENLSTFFGNWDDYTGFFGTIHGFLNIVQSEQVKNLLVWIFQNLFYIHIVIIMALLVGGSYDAVKRNNVDPLFTAFERIFSIFSFYVKIVSWFIEKAISVGQLIAQWINAIIPF
jgi:hypothetical protein